MNKHRSLILILTILTMMLAASALSADIFVVSGNPNAPPVVWEEHQKLVGLAPDIATEILDNLGLSYNLRRFGNWQNVQNKAKTGDIDMIVSAYRNREREEYLSYSSPYLSQPTVIVVEKGKEFKFSNWDSLIGKKGVTNVGESYGQKFDTFIKDKLDVKYFQFERAIQLLKLGEVDYIIIDLYTALIYTRLLQGEDAISILDPPVTIQNFHIAVRKESALAQYMPKINKQIEVKIKNGEIAEKLMMHFDKWQRLIDRRNGYFSADQKTRSADQNEYLKKQDEMARQRILKTMVDREGLPESVQ